MATSGHRALECFECGGLMDVRIETVDFKALPGVKLKDVRVYLCEPCGQREVEIPKLARLLHLLAEVVARRQGSLVPEEFRFLRKHLQWSQADAARELLDSEANETISRWESGAQPIQFAAGRLLRLLALDAVSRTGFSRVQQALKGRAEWPNEFYFRGNDWTFEGLLPKSGTAACLKSHWHVFGSHELKAHPLASTVQPQEQDAVARLEPLLEILSKLSRFTMVSTSSQVPSPDGGQTPVGPERQGSARWSSAQGAWHGAVA